MPTALTRSQCLQFHAEPIDFDALAHAQMEKNIRELRAMVASIGLDDDRAWDIYQKALESCPLDTAAKECFPQYRSGYMKQYLLKEERELQALAGMGATREDLRAEIGASIFTARRFAVSPMRQTLHQHAVCRWLAENVPFLDSAVELPNHGKGALYVENGHIVPEAGRSPESCEKSIDLQMVYTFAGKELKIYATHKYTAQEGGSQDNQYSDVITTLDGACGSTDPDTVIAAILDGPYYQRPSRSARDGGSRIEHLKKERQSRQDRILVTDHAHFCTACIPFIRDWLAAGFPEEQIQEETARLDALEAGAQARA